MEYFSEDISSAEKLILDDLIPVVEGEMRELQKEVRTSGWPCKVKAVLIEELKIAVRAPNKLYTAKRFYKIEPSWLENTFTAARNPAYYRYCADQVDIVDGIWAEFGVKFGKSVKILTKMRAERRRLQNATPLYGFDSFEGLPEATAWGPKGNLSTEGEIPVIDGARFYKGWFENTIPAFNKEHKGDLALLHVDCDIYSSTVEVLEGMRHRMVPGTVILFDDILSYSPKQKRWVGEDHEYKAFLEFVEKYKIDYEWIASIPNASQAACKIKSIIRE